MDGRAHIQQVFGHLWRSAVRLSAEADLVPSATQRTNEIHRRQQLARTRLDQLALGIERRRLRGDHSETTNGAIAILAGRQHERALGVVGGVTLVLRFAAQLADIRELLLTSRNACSAT